MGREGQKLKLGMFFPAWPSLYTSLCAIQSPRTDVPTARVRTTSLPLVPLILVNTVCERDRKTEGTGHGIDGNSAACLRIPLFLFLQRL